MTNKNLGQQPVVLTPQLSAVSKAFTDTFYQELDTEFDGFENHVLISSHDFDKPWGVWEMHPHEHTSMLFITPGEGTQNREEPGS